MSYRRYCGIYITYLSYEKLWRNYSLYRILSISKLTVLNGQKDLPWSRKVKPSDHPVPWWPATYRPDAPVVPEQHDWAYKNPSAAQFAPRQCQLKWDKHFSSQSNIWVSWYLHTWSIRTRQLLRLRFPNGDGDMSSRRRRFMRRSK